MTDVSVIDDGALVTLIPNTNEAKKYFRSFVVEPYQIKPDGSILIDARTGTELVEDLLAEDFTVEGADSLLN